MMKRQPSVPAAKHDDFVARWLHATPNSTTAKFSCTILAEIDPAARDGFQGALADAIFLHHNDPEIYRQKLEHLGYPATAAAIDRRPHAPKTRMGNFGEVLASEFLRQVRGHQIPVYRLRYNGNDESSPKGDDVLAFEFAERGRPGKDTVIVAEVKVRSAHSQAAVEEAHDALRKGHRPRPKSFMFVVDMLFREGRGDEARRLLDLSHKFGKRSLVRKSVLFLITGNQPRVPFAGVSGRLAPGLEAIHLRLDGLGDLVQTVFEAQIDVDNF